MNPAESAPDPTTPQPTVFLSYARADQKRARAVIAALEAAGIKVWWDGLLEGGDTFLPTTEAALENADAVVVLWSATSVESHWVRDEATRGRERGCLVPLRLDKSRPPLGFRQFQTIDIAHWRGKTDAPAIDAAVRAIRTLAGQHHAPLVHPQGALTSRRGLLIGGGTAAIAAAGGLAAWRWLGSGGGEGNAIAVIPFANLGKPDEAYFSAGLSEELRATLARDRLLRIAAPTSSAEFRDASTDVLAIAKKLGVSYILRGSVRHGADMLRVTVELLSGKDARLVWTQSLDRALSDVLALQTEIAAKVSEALSAEISARAVAAGRSGDIEQVGGTSSAKAFDAYLRGKALADASNSEESDRAALGRFDAAIALDEDYAVALAARSKILAVIANETGRAAEIPALYDRAIASAQAAIKAAPKLADAHLALGYATFYGRLDPKAARAPYDRAHELGIGDADVLRTYALFCAYTGRQADAKQAIEQSLTLDPLNPGAFRAAGFVALTQRDYAGCEAKMRKALELNPQISSANMAIGTALYLRGEIDDAAKAFAAEPLSLFKQQGQAMVGFKQGQQADAKAAFAAMIKEFGSNSSYQQAQVLAQWGDREGAIAALARAKAAGDSGLLLAATDALLDPIRSDARFAQLLSEMGLS